MGGKYEDSAILSMMMAHSRLQPLDSVMRWGAIIIAVGAQ